MAETTSPRKDPGWRRQALHPRNLHVGRYDFEALGQVCPELEVHLRPNPLGDWTVDFSNPDAVRCLNRALLAYHYELREWQIPDGYLCPPVPGRADYVHYAADLLARDHGGEIPSGASVRVMDIGTGASGIYPLIGSRAYGWAFLGTDIDKDAIRSVGRVVDANPPLSDTIRFIHQKNATSVFEGVVGERDRFDLSMCNPPFYASAEEARRSNERKVKNLSKGRGGGAAIARRNFGGKDAELWCAGGERKFIANMIDESLAFASQVGWFTSLVSKSEHLRPLEAKLAKVGAQRVEVVEMAQGQKCSRFLAWSFESPG